MPAESTNMDARSQFGIALVSVLWLLALLTLVVGGLTTTVRTETRAVTQALALAKARYAAQGGVELGAVNVLMPKSVRWPADGSVRNVRIGDVDVRISTTDEAGKIDLNQAPGELIATALMLGEADVNNVPSLVDAILDWRDGDDLRRLYGAEDSDYLAAGYSYGAADRGFRSIDELKLVLGMDAAVADRLHELVTIHSGQQGVNPELAPPRIAAAIAGNKQFQTAASDAAYTLNVEAVTADGVRARLSVTIRPAPGGNKPYQVLAWRQPAAPWSTNDAGEIVL